ncbi:MAG: T9SS type A sorting domain-containing protein [Bacteroidetes bacterium]|nr:T9SS type A sorting domain-containing protein [Bacteroidota bacterium]
MKEIIFRSIFCFILSIFLIGKTKAQPVLIFQSGFEGSTKVVMNPGTNDYGAPLEHITGIDNTFSVKNNWTTDWAAVNGGNMQVQYTGGDSTKRFAKVIPEPGNTSNKVLQYWLNDSWLASEGQYKSRIQTNLYGIKGGYKDFYQSVRMFLTADFNQLKSYPNIINWLTISEFWNNEWWVTNEPYGFRVTLGIGKPTSATSELNFILNAENAGQVEVWKGNNTNIKVPIGKWFTMEYYFKEGNKQTGQFWMAITPDGGSKQVVFDIHNFTHNTSDPAPNGLTGYNPMKLYTSNEVVAFVKSKGKTLQVYWDDFKLWKNKQPEISTSVNNINTNIQQEIKIFPNPSTDFVVLEGINIDSKIELYDILGNIVISQIANTNDTKIDLSILEPGIYFYKIIARDKSSQTGKLIKNN